MARVGRRNDDGPKILRPAWDRRAEIEDLEASTMVVGDQLKVARGHLEAVRELDAVALVHGDERPDVRQVEELVADLEREHSALERACEIQHRETAGLRARGPSLEDVAKLEQRIAVLVAEIVGTMGRLPVLVRELDQAIEETQAAVGTQGAPLAELRAPNGSLGQVGHRCQSLLENPSFWPTWRQHAAGRGE